MTLCYGCDAPIRWWQSTVTSGELRRQLWLTWMECVVVEGSVFHARCAEAYVNGMKDSEWDVLEHKMEL